MFYGVVEFKSSNSNIHELSLVPLIWLVKNDKKCYWPNRTYNKIPLAGFIKGCPPPKKNWPLYTVSKVHLKTGKYKNV